MHLYFFDEKKIDYRNKEAENSGKYVGMYYANLRKNGGGRKGRGKNDREKMAEGEKGQEKNSRGKKMADGKNWLRKKMANGKKAEGMNKQKVI